MYKYLLSIWMMMLFVSGAYAQSVADTWAIKADSINPAYYYGETVANGMIGIVSSAQPFKVNDVVLNGTYDVYGRGRVSNILKTFNFVNMQLAVNGTSINDYNQVQHVRQVLDMKHANLSTIFDYKDEATIQYSYYALRQLPYTALVDVVIMAKKDIEITPATVMEAPDILNDVQPYYESIDNAPHAPIALLTSTAKSPTGKLLVAASNSFIFNEGVNNINTLPELTHDTINKNIHLLKFKKKLKAGEHYHFSIVGSTITSAQNTDPLNEAERLTIYALLQGRDKLVQQHNAAWDELWKSDIIIDGDVPTQRDVHSMLYHLYAFTHEGVNAAYSVSPMGLSGLGYNGHIFWDAEIWMFPSLLLLHPEMAKSLLDYRYERLQAAKQNAYAHGYKGAMYPWESAESGNEETPVWALTGPYEHHITADIAIAVWNYYCVTQDKQWLREKGYPMLKETADFWASRVERNGAGHYDIKNVVAADEYAQNVDNNAYTNAAAKANLKYATDAARILGITPNADWMTVADNIPILKLADGTTKEHATYNGETIKQADVNLLAYPLHEITDTTTIKKDMAYYMPRVGDGPAMTQAIFSILYSRLGDVAKAYQIFKIGYTPNMRPPFGVLAETATGNNPYFATGAGGMIQAMLNGFGGLEITSTGVVQYKTKLPAQWHSLTLTGIGAQHKTDIIK